MPKGAVPKLYTDPTTGLSLTYKQWMAKLEIAEVTFRVRISKYGENDPRTYLSKSELSLPSQRVQKEEGGRTARQRQQNLARIPSPSTWEKENIKMR